MPGSVVARAFGSVDRGLMRGSVDQLFAEETPLTAA
jgi:hypothetical protein